MIRISKINHIFNYVRNDDYSQSKYVFNISESLKHSIANQVGEFKHCTTLICSDQWNADGYECTDVFIPKTCEFIVIDVRKIADSINECKEASHNRAGFQGVMK